jgi:hypothetical protein
MSDSNALEQNTLNFFSDLEKIRLTAEDMGDISTKEILSLVPVRRPRKGEFFRAHPDPAMCLAVAIFQDQDEPDEVFFVAPSMRDELSEDMKAVSLQLCVSRKCAATTWRLALCHLRRSEDRVAREPSQGRVDCYGRARRFERIHHSIFVTSCPDIGTG